MPSVAEGSGTPPVEGAPAYPPLILLQTWPKEESRYLITLIDALGQDQPVVGIPAPAGEAVPTCVDGWVDYYAGRLAELRLEPPYFLCGWSFGGVVALALARQLRAADIPVAFVGMVDTWRVKRNPKGIKRYLEYHVAAMLEQPRGTRVQYAKGRLREGAHRRNVRFKRLILRAGARFGLVPPVPTSAEVLGIERWAIMVSNVKYEPAPYDGPVSIYSCLESIARFGGDPSLGWARWLRGGFEQVTLSSSHFTLFEPEGIAGLADALWRSLRIARERAGLVVDPGA